LISPIASHQTPRLPRSAIPRLTVLRLVLLHHFMLFLLFYEKECAATEGGITEGQNAMFPARPLILASLPIACALAVPVPAFAQKVPDDKQVTDQTNAVNKAAEELNKLLTDPASVENPPVLDAMSKITIGDPMDVNKLLEALKQVTRKQVTQLLEMRGKRDALAVVLAELTASKNHFAYTANVSEPVRANANTALDKGANLLKTEPYGKLLGESKRPGDAVTALLKVYTTLSDQAALSLFDGLDTDPPASELIAKLASGLPEWAKSFAKIDELEKIAKQTADLPITLLLPQPEMGNPVHVAFAAKFAALKARENVIADKLPEWIGKVNEQVERRTLDVVGKANNVRRRQPGAVAVAIVEGTNIRDYQSDVTNVLKAWDANKQVILARHKAKGEQAVVLIGKLKTHSDELDANALMLTGLLGAGGQEQMTLEVRLSYFPNVNQLIRILNPTAKLIDPTNGQPATVAVQKRVELRQQEAKLLDARQRVADVKTRIQRIEAELAQAQVAAQRTSQALSKALGQKAGLSDALAKLETTLAATTDPAQRTNLQTQITNTKEKQEVQQLAVDAATTDNAAAQDRLKALSDEKTGLPQKREEAAVELKTEEDKLNELRRDLPGLAQDESDAFAAARDNAPYYRAEPLFDDPDPLRRVFIWGNPDSRTLYLRGSRDDVAAAREAVAEFDKPIPFTKLSFFTMQLNGSDKAFQMENRDGKIDPAAKTAFVIVEDNLDAVRTGTKIITDALRDAIAEEITDKVKSYAPPPFSTSEGTSARLKRYEFYSPRIREALGYAPSWWKEGDGSTQFDLAKEFPNITHFTDIASVTRFTLPDPVRLTTLGEMIFIASLGSEKSRENIETRFRKKIEAKLQVSEKSESKNAPEIQPGDSIETKRKAERSKSGKNRNQLLNDLLRAAFTATLPADWADNPMFSFVKTAFPKMENARLADAMTSILRILGLSEVGKDKTNPTDAAQPKDEEPMTPAQKEILDALLSKARTDVSGTIYNLIRQLDQMPEELRYQNSQVALDMREQYLPLVGWLVSSPRGRNPFHNDDAEKILKRISQNKDKVRMSWRNIGAFLLLGETAFDGGAIPVSLGALSPETLKRMDRMAFEIARQQYVANPLSKTTGRIEAADMMIRELIDVFDDDLKRLIRIPAMEAIRDSIRAKLVGVSFGGVEETAFMAANRRVARVDPVGSGALTVEEKANFAEAAKNLSDVILKQQEREKTRDSILGAAATVGTAEAIGAATPTAMGLGLTSLIGSLLGSNDEAQTTANETYSISSGNLYKITPIFGPSGQGMRFQFDFVGTTRLREPGGTTNPAIPRIERHTVNTEVGLSNLDMRQIASFDANYQLGIPRKQSGGLPILNAIPGLNRIPIIGYFAVREGQPALRQKSIIMAHSVMYPTIADIAGLMLDSTTLPVTFSPEPPAATREYSELSPFVDKPQFLRDSFLIPGSVIGIRLRLRRPMQNDSAMTLNLQTSDKLEIIGKDSQAIGRGQDSALFYVKIPISKADLKTPVLTHEQEQQIKAEANSRISQGMLAFEEVNPPTSDPRADEKAREQELNRLLEQEEAKRARILDQLLAENSLDTLETKLEKVNLLQAKINSLPAGSIGREEAETEKSILLADISKAFKMKDQYLVAELSDNTGRTERLPFVLKQYSDEVPLEKEDFSVEWRSGERRLSQTEPNRVASGDVITALIKPRYLREGTYTIVRMALLRSGNVVIQIPPTPTPDPSNPNPPAPLPLGRIDASETTPHDFALTVPANSPGYATVIVEIVNDADKKKKPLVLRLSVYITTSAGGGGGLQPKP
jgi:hypothetical protein